MNGRFIMNNEYDPHNITSAVSEEDKTPNGHYWLQYNERWLRGKLKELDKKYGYTSPKRGIR
jgi:hypothetical protein